MNFKSLTLLAIVCLALCIGSASGGTLYAASDRIDKFSGGNWTTLNVPEILFNVVQMSLDATGKLYVSGVFANAPNTRPFPGIHFFDPANPDTVGRSLFIGRFAFDASNNVYTTSRYTPVGTCFSPITKLPPSLDETAGVTLGLARAVADVVSTGGSIVIAGNFDKVYSNDLTSFIPALRVARWTGTAWTAIGSGIAAGPVSRIVADADGNLVGLVGNNLWRWDGTAWTAYPLALTATAGTPAIVDLDFGASTLFLTGNFKTVNGVAAVNVTAISWTGATIHVAAVGDGLPAMDPRTILAFSDALVWVGGAQGGQKAVSVWRGGATWTSLGVGFTPSDRSTNEVNALAFAP